MPRPSPALPPLLALAVVLAAPALPAAAGEVEILDAAASRGAGGWTVSVALRHADSGWDHYADAWRVLGPDGAVLGERVLVHPHEHEQPFTRSLSGVAIPEGLSAVTIEAHDTVHGWSPQRFTLALPEE